MLKRPALTQCAGPASKVVRTALRHLVPSASHNSRALLLPPPGQQWCKHTGCLHATMQSCHVMSCHVMSPPHVTTDCMTMLAASSRVALLLLHNMAAQRPHLSAAAPHGSPATQSVMRKLGVPVLRGACGLQPCAHHCWPHNTSVMPCSSLLRLSDVLCLVAPCVQTCATFFWRRRAIAALSVVYPPLSARLPCLQHVLMDCIIGSVACCITLPALSAPTRSTPTLSHTTHAHAVQVLLGVLRAAATLPAACPPCCLPPPLRLLH